MRTVDTGRGQNKGNLRIEQEKKKHHSINKIYSLKNLKLVWEKYKRSTGVDNVTIADFTANRENLL
jgi:hypothetical protein